MATMATTSDVVAESADKPAGKLKSRVSQVLPIQCKCRKMRGRHILLILVLWLITILPTYTLWSANGIQRHLALSMSVLTHISHPQLNLLPPKKTYFCRIAVPYSQFFFFLMAMLVRVTSKMAYYTYSNLYAPGVDYTANVPVNESTSLATWGQVQLCQVLTHYKKRSKSGLNAYWIPNEVQHQLQFLSLFDVQAHGHLYMQLCAPNRSVHHCNQLKCYVVYASLRCLQDQYWYTTCWH